MLAGYRLAFMIESVYGNGYKDKDLDIIEDLNPDQRGNALGGFIIFLLILTTFSICCALLNNKFSKIGCAKKCKETLIAIKIFFSSLLSIWR